jgi:hypothetical protein
LVLGTGVLLVAAIVAVEARHKYRFGNFVSYGMDVHVLRQSASIGIPGIGSMYSAELCNYTFKPIQITGCKGPKDTSPYYEIFYRYEVQRWDPGNGNWIQVMGIPSGQCPKENVTLTDILPRRSLVAVDWEATAAREGFHKGDWARFRIFTSFNAEEGASDQMIVASPAFRIDEEATDRSTDYRIAH